MKIIDPTSAAAVIAELTARKYETPAINSYAKAAKSWCDKGSDAWKVWQQVEDETSNMIVVSKK